MRLAILSSLSLSLAAPLVAQQTDDQKAVIRAIETLFNALKADDTAGMRAVMHPQGRIIQTGTREGAPFARVNALNDFLSSIGGAKGRGLEERVYNPEVRIDDNLAVAWVYYDFRVGGQVTHCGVDAYHLVRLAEGWKILEIVDTQRREACDKINIASQASRDRQVDYVEIPVTDVGRAKAFYSGAFGWTFTDYGADYTSFMDGRLSGGLRKETKKAGNGVLVVIYAKDLEGTRGKVTAAGARISKDIHEFPGGRRFHFTDPSGNELAVWSDR